MIATSIRTAVLAAALMLGPATVASAQQFDYGDAPDGATAGYFGANVSGNFPALDATPGPRHTLGGFHLGAAVDAESDSHQVNHDLFDDGVTANLASCSDASSISVVLNGADLPAATRSSGHTGYVN